MKAGMLGEFITCGVSDNFMDTACGSLRALPGPEEAFLYQKGAQTLGHLRDVVGTSQCLEIALENLLLLLVSLEVVRAGLITIIAGHFS